MARRIAARRITTAVAASTARNATPITIRSPDAQAVVGLSLNSTPTHPRSPRRPMAPTERAEWISFAGGVVTLALLGTTKGGLQIPVTVPYGRIGLAYQLVGPDRAWVRMQLLADRSDIHATADFVPGDSALSGIPLSTGIFRTTLRTSTGRTVELEPGALAFLQVPAIGQSPMLTPVGSFAFGVAGQSQVSAHRLLVGTASTEFVTLQLGDVLDFVPSMPARAHLGVGAPKLTSEVTTSWVRVLRPSDGEEGDASDSIVYSIQASDMALHARSDDPVLLEFHPVPTAAFPGSGIAFPIVPVAAPGNWARLVEADEGCIATVRRQVIVAGALSVKAGRVLTMTPQGFVVGLEGGTFIDLSLAVNEGTELRLETVAPPFARALTSSGAFVVADEAAGIGTIGLDTLTVSGWPLRLGLDAEGSVLVMKLRTDLSIRDLSETPGSWTSPDEFTSDVAGLEARLKGFIAGVDTATSHYPDLYRTVADVINDSEWTGMLVIDGPVSLSSFPTQLRGLLGGLDHSGFCVHHFGVALNRVGTGIVVEQSSVFGLIDYRGEGASIDETGYDFDVLSLQARFANTRLVDFRSRIRVVLNEVFGETPTLATRSIELAGSYELQEGEPVYSFTYEGDRELHMPGAVIERLEITKAQFATAETPASGNASEVEATFTFWGELGFGSFGDLDVLSFSGIEYAGLELGTRFRIEGDEVKETTFFFRPERARLDQARAIVRSGSLFEGMPLRVGRLAAVPGRAGLEAYFPVSAIGLEGVDLGGGSRLSPDYALHAVLPLGSNGPLREAEELLALDILIAWESTTDRVGIYLQLPGAGREVSTLRLLGPLRMAVGLPALRRLVSSEGDSVITLALRRASLAFFGVPIPPGYTFELVLFADPQKVKSGKTTSAAWYVAFMKVPTDFSITIGDGGRGVGLGELGEGGDDKEDDEETKQAKQPLEFEFMGVGQQIAVEGVSDDVEVALDAMKGLVLTLPADIDLDDWSGIEAAVADKLLEIYDPESGWAVGFDFTILEALRMAVVFYEPTPMGLLVELGAGPVEGLAFEILYERVTDEVGVYRLMLALPDSLSQIEMGQVSITLPALGLEIYTNGDFRVDVGFPKDLDFSASTSIQVLPFVGFGGFYFAKMSSGSNTAIEEILRYEDDRFDPVLEMGIGLAIGLGKTFKKGILSAALTVSLVGILEGSVGWYRPGEERAKDPKLSRYLRPTFSRAPDYYHLRGTVALVGTVQGEVDFGIIKAGVYIKLYAGATLELVAYEDLEIELFIGVKVAVKVKVWIFTISFSFSIEMRFSWSIPVSGVPPWELPTSAPQALMFAASADAVPEEIVSWDPEAIFASKRQLVLEAVAQDTIDRGKVASVVLLILRTADARGFTTLADLCLRWAIRSGLGSPRRVSQDQLRHLSDLIDASDSTPARTEATYPLDYKTILAFLSNNFDIEIRLAPRTADCDVDAAVFPMLPWLSARTAGGEWHNYRTHNARGRAYEQSLATYFREPMVGIPDERDPGAKSSRKSMASILLEDYFAVLTKALVEQGLATLKREGENDVTVPRLVEMMREKRRGTDDPSDFANTAGMATRFLLHGLRIPPSIPKAGSLPDPEPLFSLVGQQFPVDLVEGEWWVQLRANRNAPVSLLAPEGKSALTIEFDEDTAAGLDRDFTVDATFEPSPTVGRRGESYALDRSITWVDNRWIRPFPPNLTSALTSEADLQVAVGVRLVNSHWVTRVELPIRRIAGNGDIVEAGGVSEFERVLLGRLSFHGGVEIVYRGDDGPVRAVGAVMVKTNLTTQSAPPSPPTRVMADAALLDTQEEAYTAAADDDPGAFVDLVRELGVVNGTGFYLWIPGLPDDLFDETGHASVTLVIDAGSIASTGSPESVRIPQGTNAISTTILDEDPISFTAVNRHMWTPLLMPGAVAFDLVRSKPSESEYLQTLFHLTEYRVLGSKLGSTRWSVPVGPTEPEGAGQSGGSVPGASVDNGKWRYHQVIDAHLHLRGHDDRSKAGRYATVGSTLRVDVTFLDPFGNRAPNSRISDGTTLKIPVRYTDRLVPIAEWPGTSLVYRLNKRTRKLTVDITFTPSVIADTGETDNSELRAEVGRLYEKVLQQLHGPGVSATLKTSLAGVESGTALLRNTLRSFLASVLDAIETEGDQRVTRRVSLPIEMDPERVPQIQQVRVEVVIARQIDFVDEMAAEKIPRSVSATTRATPNLEGAGDANARLVAFAEIFEAIYPDVKLATGRSELGTAEFWSVPFARDEIGRKRRAPEFFAPRPLSTTLVEGSATAPDGTPLRLVAVDLDEWASTFLAHVDAALAPTQIGGWLGADAAQLDALIEHKRRIADAIVDSVAPVLGQSPPQAAILAARQRFRQRVRRRLSAASDVETVVWLSLRAPNLTERGFARPRLYGTVVSGGEIAGGADQRSGIALSSAKVQMSQSSEVSFLFDTTTPEHARSVPVMLGLTITHVEHEIDREDEDYTSSAWLTLVIAEANIPLGTNPIEVPVPLRRYPVPPALAGQSAEPSHMEAMTLAEAASWDYRMAYRSAAAAQDTVGIHIQFNDRGAAHAVAEPSVVQPLTGSLPEALARYFNQFPDGFDPGQRADFVERVGEVAARWPAYGEGPEVGAGVLADLVKYDVVETSRGGDKPAHIMDVTQIDGIELDYMVTLDGSLPRLVEGNRLVFTRPKGSRAQRVREIELAGLDVRVHENARAHLVIRRNEHLVERRDTNPVFVYRTPVVRFEDEVTPLLTSSRMFPISDQDKTIEAHLRDFLDELLDPVAEGIARPMSIGVVYRYDLDRKGRRRMVVPLIQTAAFEFDQNRDFSDEEGFTTRLAAWLTHWRSAQGPCGLRARFEFDVRVFAALSEDVDLPVLRLGHLYLPIDQIIT